MNDHTHVAFDKENYWLFHGFLRTVISLEKLIIFFVYNELSGSLCGVII